jgi:hypothetical protein
LQSVADLRWPCAPGDSGISGRAVVSDMPIHLPPITRRRFLFCAGAALLPTWSASSAPVDEELVAILNDTHIGGKQKPDAPIPQHLSATVNYLLGLERRPAAVFINGDLALRDGQPDDYVLFAKLIAPLREASIVSWRISGLRLRPFSPGMSASWKRGTPISFCSIP